MSFREKEKKEESPDFSRLSSFYGDFPQLIPGEQEGKGNASFLPSPDATAPLASEKGGGGNLKQGGRGGGLLVVHRETDDTGDEGITTWPNAAIPYM